MSHPRLRTAVEMAGLYGLFDGRHNLQYPSGWKSWIGPQTSAEWLAWLRSWRAGQVEFWQRQPKCVQAAHRRITRIDAAALELTQDKPERIHP